MSERDGTTAWVGTRKGLFRIEIDGGTPVVGEPAFIFDQDSVDRLDQRPGARFERANSDAVRGRLALERSGSGPG